MNRFKEILFTIFMFLGAELSIVIMIISFLDKLF